ncbi:MAG: nucleotidyl transferase AbiEii/AbiGii toxin family protein, partial [Cyanobacteria bacterium P01_E01_bin.35]
MANIQIPSKLPLLEALCWNIADPYQLTPQEILGIYEERWHYLDVLGTPNPEEIQFIQQIIQAYGGLPLIEMTEPDKSKIYESIELILKAINLDLLNQHRVYLGGGALVALKYQHLRYSSDLDFLVSPPDYQQLKLAINRDRNTLIKDRPTLIIDQPRIDRYGIRYPITVKLQEEPIKFKLEIVAEYALSFSEPDRYKSIPCLNQNDLIASKLLTNADRWADRNKFSRDLIDLTMLILDLGKLPEKAVASATAIYPDAMECLYLAVKQFQSLPDYRQHCYQNLQITKKEIIIN